MLHCIATDALQHKIFKITRVIFPHKHFRAVGASPQFSLAPSGETTDWIKKVRGEVQKQYGPPLSPSNFWDTCRLIYTLQTCARTEHQLRSDPLKRTQR